MLRCATLSVEDADASARTYEAWLDYEVVERGEVPAGLAASWGCPGSASAAYAVLAPASGKDTYIRLVEQPPVPGYAPLRTYGWNATEVCVQDVLAVNERMTRPDSPFEVIGPPREIEGLNAIYPMQVKGPDAEILYFTQIRSDLPAYKLPRASVPIDQVFIMVAGCSDLKASMRWFREAVGLQDGREMDIVYTMLAGAYGSDPEALHTIATMIDDDDVFLEVDQYPKEATPRPGHDGLLPPGAALTTFKTARFDALSGWIAPPEVREGPVYAGRRAGTLRGPDGILAEMVEA
jgi:catechol 2,3-dioxygenase-like lactoylglutathione lyase family enzyme